MAIVCQTESRVEHGWLKFSGLNMMEGGSWVTCHVEKVSYSVSAHFIRLLNLWKVSLYVYLSPILCIKYESPF